ncbi:hypothetical protein CKO51_25440 [Rhodopirellula sp. SM50]|nr:hypothetical protein CKO51_25440 [Rhodopirellula sp. SM50]
MITTYNTFETAKILQCSRDQVRALILSGRLKATNISLGSQRARWVVKQQDIEAFLTPEPPIIPTRRKKKPRRKQWIT